MRSTNFGSILIFASCGVGTCNILCGSEWEGFYSFALKHIQVDYTPCIFGFSPLELFRTCNSKNRRSDSCGSSTTASNISSNLIGIQ